MQLKIDSREQNNSVRYNTCIKHFKEKGYTVTTEQLPTGDYIFNDQVVFEFKVWSDFMASITDGRLWNESQKQMENYPIHFVVIHGTNRDYMEAYKYNGLEHKHITGAIARLNTYTKVIRGTGTLQDTFELMRCTAEKCLDDKTLCRQFGTKSVNVAFNFLAYCVDDIKGERAKTIVNFLKLETLQDLMELNHTTLTSVPGIGDALANKILAALGKI